jgi:hypothetical protein
VRDVTELRRAMRTLFEAASDTSGPSGD